MDERLHRTGAAAKTIGADWVVLTNVDSVAYATGHAASIEAGSSPFAGGPTTAFVSADGACAVVAPNVEAGAAKRSWADDVVLYEGFAFDHDAGMVANYGEAIATAARKLGIGGTAAVEPATFPAVLSGWFDHTIDFTLPLRRVRATKTTEERALLKRAAQAAAVGQQRFRTATRAGRTELDIFGDIRAAMENFAGERIAVTGDFLSGKERTAGFTGWPIDRIIAKGDPLISDLAPRVAGYWGDSCSSAFLGEPSPGYLALFDAAKTALEGALEMMRPGLVISELDAELRRRVGRAGYAYPHHSGHSIGTSVHEWPRLVPFERAPLEVGMFLMVEPGAYDSAIGGVRTEWMIEITDSGCAAVAPFELVPRIAA